MTERKPPGTSWESWIEAQIRVAQEQGAFDNLPGAGKPLPNMDQEYDPMWWVKQLAEREQLSLLPPSLELARKVEKELATIEKLPDEAAVRRRIAALNVEIARLERDRDGRAADAPRQAGRRPGRRALAAHPLRHAGVARRKSFASPVIGGGGPQGRRGKAPSRSAVLISDLKFSRLSVGPSPSAPFGGTSPV